MANSPLRPLTSVLARYPIPIELIAALYRADAVEFERMMETMPEYGRARVAAYCTDRDRLHSLGARIARTCQESTLVQAAGAKVGADLFASSRAGAEATH